MSAPDIWHDDEGVWADTGTGLLGPFTDENLAERAFAAEMIREVSEQLAERTDDHNAQEWAVDLNTARAALDHDYAAKENP